MSTARGLEWYNRLGNGWWQKRSRREQYLLMGGAGVLLLSIILLLTENIWHFYRTLPGQRAIVLQREWLIEDVKSLIKNPVAFQPPKMAETSSFLSKVNQSGVNGSCSSQGTESWLCTGQTASLEAVQQWWMKGRREGFYVERFEANAESPGRIRWTMLVKRS